MTVPDATPGLDVFDYLDYRAFLRDYYTERKVRRGFSFRGFSKRAGLGSPNYLKLVMDGDRNLTNDMATRFAHALGLGSDSANYFAELVRFTQAKTSSERHECYTQLTRFRRYREARPLELAHAQYHSQWFIPAVRELAARTDFDADPTWIASRIWPEITLAEAEHAIQTLRRLGLLVVNEEDGRLIQGESLVSTGVEPEGIHSVLVANYHRMMLRRAAESIDDVPPEARDISSLTLCLGKDGLRRLKQRIQRFRRELLELSTSETDPRQVVQVNFQLFPLSRSDAEKNA